MLPPVEATCAQGMCETLMSAEALVPAIRKVRLGAGDGFVQGLLVPRPAVIGLVHTGVKIVAKAGDRIEVLGVAGQEQAILVEEQLSVRRRKLVVVGGQVAVVVFTWLGCGTAAPSKMVFVSRICNRRLTGVHVRGAVNRLLSGVVVRDAGVVGRRLETVIGRKNMEGLAVQSACGG